MQANINVTPAAVTYIKKMLEKNEGVGLRVSIKKTGCSGYSYVPEIATEESSSDVVVAIDGVNVLLDGGWLDLLNGITIDYIEEDKSGLKQKRLVFNNDKESGRCGCGESFHIE